jgi:universal stress protein A
LGERPIPDIYEILKNLKSYERREESNRRGTMIKIQNIVVPVDFSENSRKAVLYAAELARDRKGRLHLLHVINQRLIDTVQELTLKGYEGDFLKALEKMLQARDEELREFVSPESVQGVEVEYSIRKGKPGEEIIKFAQENSMDLIVIGTQGRSPLAAALMGSAARTVVNRAKCPVLVVHPDDHCFAE